MKELVKDLSNNIFEYINTQAFDVGEFSQLIEEYQKLALRMIPIIEVMERVVLQPTETKNLVNSINSIRFNIGLKKLALTMHEHINAYYEFREIFENKIKMVEKL